MRLAGTYEKACRDYDLWEIDQRIANDDDEITKRGFAQETVPSKIFSGKGDLRFRERRPVKLQGPLAVGRELVGGGGRRELRPS